MKHIWKKVTPLFMALVISLAFVGCGSNSATTTSTTDITKEDAKAVALEDAGVAESDTSRLKVTKENDDGAKYYEVEFSVDKTEYDYEIAMDGSILSKDSDAEGFDISADAAIDGTSGAAIDEAKAKEIALAKVPGATEENMKIILERDDGKEVYEGTILYDQVEYGFEIDATTGDVLSWEEDRN